MPNKNETKPIKQQTLAEVVRAAKAAGMTYGKYVEKMEAMKNNREKAVE